MPLEPFKAAEALTMGVELELQLVNPDLNEDIYRLIEDAHLDADQEARLEKVLGRQYHLERQRLVQQALASLSVEQRQAIALAYYWGMSQSEIAEQLKLPLGTVKTRMRLGMIRLREVLAPHGEGLLS